jgi:hypothetical protein
MSDLVFTDPGDSAPARTFRAIVVATPFAKCRAIYVGTGGTLVLANPNGGTDGTFVNVPSGFVLPVETTNVVSVTGAANLLALY